MPAKLLQFNTTQGNHQPLGPARVLGPSGSLRMVLFVKCWSCLFEWQAPALGACPRCHGMDLRIEHAVECGAPII